ncbi:MFS transporter [Diaporthe helianthi]|uniref:MFS transporter n=1 Tax=Diaporthe helianthi TaxID=158607 RepID=A0A2P5HIA3_DIAHE|nr:MFS transporter [Diaporthe helianthi]
MRMRAEEMEAYNGGSGHYSKQDVKEAAKDVKSWLHGVIQVAVVTILYAQYMVIPVNIWGAIVYGVGAMLSDKYKKRFLPLVVCAPFGITGYAILLCKVSPAAQYLATYLIATACFLCTGGNIAWLSGNCAPDGKRAASLGILLTLTNIGGVVSGQIYQTNAAPEFALGHAWSLGCLVFAWLGWWAVRWIYLRRQAGKDKAASEGVGTIPGIHTDRSRNFKYMI